MQSNVMKRVISVVLSVVLSLSLFVFSVNAAPSSFDWTNDYGPFEDYNEALSYIQNALPSLRDSVIREGVNLDNGKIQWTYYDSGLLEITGGGTIPDEMFHDGLSPIHMLNTEGIKIKYIYVRGEFTEIGTGAFKRDGLNWVVLDINNTCEIAKHILPDSKYLTEDFIILYPKYDDNINDDIVNNAISVNRAYYWDGGLRAIKAPQVETPTEPPTEAQNIITTSGNNGKSIVTLDYETANLKVTVPTVLPVNVDSNNNVTVADNAQINNLSNGSIDVTNAEIQTDEWSVVGFNTDFTKVPVDTKQYGFKINGDDVADGIDTSVFDTIEGESTHDVAYDANVAIQSSPIDGADIGHIVFTIAWHTAA